MLKHRDIWTAIDRLAALNGLSPSGLARRSGLDPTTFNPSKRQSADGKQRWPSTESIAKILEATGSAMGDFTALIGDPGPARAVRRIPLIGYAQAGAEGYFDDAGYPAGQGWDEIAVPDVADPHAYALEISGDSMEPVYREGDVVIVSPQAALRRGDRLVLRTATGEVTAKELGRQTARTVALKSLNQAYPDRTLALREIAWMARIVWASQ
jgi:phage repressor protein C with HTH and peptisase S24 domain